MNTKTKVKDTSYKYGLDSQLVQAEKYKNRKTNHWRHRIDLAIELVENKVFPRFDTKSKEDIVLADIGCSIGTFAIEFAKLGYQSYGVDFDAVAIDMAKEIAAEEQVTPTLICADISTWISELPTIDIVICFDIFEHLHDDELGAFLQAIKRHMSDKGVLVFHTFPAEYDYIFYAKKIYRWILMPFTFLPQNYFNKIVKVYSLVIDIFMLIIRGKTYKESIKKNSHCNLTSTERLSDVFNRSGFDIDFIETENLFQRDKSVKDYFNEQPVTHRNIYGVVTPHPED